jgi:hypothetical protein
MPGQFLPGGLFAEIKPRRGQDSRRAVSVDLAIGNAHGGFDAGLSDAVDDLFCAFHAQLFAQNKNACKPFGACPARF